MNRIFLLPLVTVIAFFVLYFALASTTSFLSVEKGYAIGEVSRWCERISGGFFREPFNALSNLGLLYRDIGELDKALEYLDKALLLNPDSSKILTNKGLAFKAINNLGAIKDMINC